MNGTATATTTSKLPVAKLNEVIDRMRDVQSEGDRWELAESLVKLVPTGTMGFGDIIDRAKDEGVDGGLSINTLRLYRDTAVRWPSDRRVKNVSFSAHREAMVLPTVADRVKMLSDLSKTMGASKVTVASVRKAVAVKQGKKPTAAKGGPTSTKMVDVLSDLTNRGGAELIAAIGNETDQDRIDKLNAGLTKVLAHVEKLRAKAARAAKPSKPTTAPVKGTAPAPKPTTKPSTNGKAKKPTGDMRGL